MQLHGWTYYYTKESKLDKDKYHMILLTCEIQKKNDSKSLFTNRNRLIDVKKKIHVYQRGEGNNIFLKRTLTTE